MTRLFSAPLLALLVSCSHDPPPATPNDPLGQVVMFSLPNESGALMGIPVAGARLTVLSFFGPHCEPCRKSVPGLYAQRRALAAHGAKLVLIAVLAKGESPEDAKRALESWGIEEPFLIDSHGTASRTAAVSALPRTLVLDAHGVAKWMFTGEASVENIIMVTR